MSINAIHIAVTAAAVTTYGGGAAALMGGTAALLIKIAGPPPALWRRNYREIPIQATPIVPKKPQPIETKAIIETAPDQIQARNASIAVLIASQSQRLTSDISYRSTAIPQLKDEIAKWGELLIGLTASDPKAAQKRWNQAIGKFDNIDAVLGSNMGEVRFDEPALQEVLNTACSMAAPLLFDLFNKDQSHPELVAMLEQVDWEHILGEAEPVNIPGITPLLNTFLSQRKRALKAAKAALWLKWPGPKQVTAFLANKKLAEAEMYVRTTTSTLKSTARKLQKMNDPALAEIIDLCMQQSVHPEVQALMKPLSGAYEIAQLAIDIARDNMDGWFFTNLFGLLGPLLQAVLRGEQPNIKGKNPLITFAESLRSDGPQAAPIQRLVSGFQTTYEEIYTTPEALEAIAEANCPTLAFLQTMRRNITTAMDMAQ